MLPHRARVDLGAMAMKGYSAFPKAPALLELDFFIIHLIWLSKICTAGFFYENSKIYCNNINIFCEGFIYFLVAREKQRISQEKKTLCTQNKF